MPVEIQPDNFDSEIRKIWINITNLNTTIIAKPYVVVNCMVDPMMLVGIKTTILPNVFILLHLATNKTEDANYYKDTPIYGLRVISPIPNISFNQLLQPRMSLCVLLQYSDELLSVFEWQSQFNILQQI